LGYKRRTYGRIKENEESYHKPNLGIDWRIILKQIIQK
jgi:hypothetical protein